MPRRASGCRPEPAIIDALRSDGDLTLSLVASNDGVLVGHVAFPPIPIGEFAHGWYGLGPVSVKPEYQQRGIGTSDLPARNVLWIGFTERRPSGRLLFTPAFGE